MTDENSKEPQVIHVSKTPGEILELLKIRAQNIVDVGFAMRASESLDDYHSAMSALSKELECDCSILTRIPVALLGYNAEGVKMVPHFDVVKSRGVSERKKYVKNVAISAIGRGMLRG